VAEGWGKEGERYAGSLSGKAVSPVDACRGAHRIKVHGQVRRGGPWGVLRVANLGEHAIWGTVRAPAVRGAAAGARHCSTGRPAAARTSAVSSQHSGNHVRTTHVLRNPCKHWLVLALAAGQPFDKP
jgi:hypothetical protein